MNFQKYINLPSENAGLSVLDKVYCLGVEYPIFSKTKIVSKESPTLVLTGGCHGLEEIGVLIVLRFMKEFFKDEALYKSINFACIPSLNPYGLVNNSRSNGDGVDLMRNAPNKTKEKTFFMGGQGWSSKLPYYSGKELARENRVLIQFMESIWEKTSGPVFYVDIHSGFGLRTLLWPPHIPDNYFNKKMFSVFQNTASSQGMSYRKIPYNVSGDMFDYIYTSSPTSRFASATMEIGFWQDILKVPWRIFRIKNWFNPSAKQTEEVMEKHCQALMQIGKLISKT